MYRLRPLLMSVISLTAITGFSQGKINLMGQAKLQEINAGAKVKGTDASTNRIEAIVTFNDGWSSEILAQYGAEIVLELSDNEVIASIPADNIASLAENDAVYYIEFGNEYHLTMDFARAASNVDAVHSGVEYNGATVSYTGKGVVTGLMDTGIDPNHLNFTDEGGNCRVKEAYDYIKNVTATTPSAIKRFTTDAATATHGTHVAGIMAGSYNREGEYTYMNSTSDRLAQTATGDIPYYGVATGSDIVMCGGSLTDANILKGIKAIIAYGQASGQPAVVNLSLGSNYGPHDGTESLSKNISKYAQQGIICLAAGNEGDTKMFVGKTFTDDDTTLKTIVDGAMSSGIDIWTNSSEPVTVSIGFLTTMTKKFTPFATITDANQNVQADDSFSASMTGACTMMSEVNRLNNRFHVMISGEFGPAGNMRNNIAIQITGKAGQQVYVYGFGDYKTSFTDNGISGYTDGTTDGTISTLACADGVIAVGSYTTRTSWPTFAGGYSYTSGYKVDAMSPFSSYGSAYNGESLPHVSAPGAAIISSLNRYYTNNLSSTQINANTTAKAEPTSGLTSYWGEMQGTSMACPYLAGTIALWLEADPTLTRDAIIEILNATSEAPTSTDPLVVKQWGAGKLDALAGLKEVLRRKSEGGVEGITVDNGGYLITPAGERAWEITVDGASRVEATLYNLQGVAVAHATGEHGTATIDATASGAGIYLLNVTAPNHSPITRKIRL